MRNWKRRWLAGTLALTLCCSALLSGGSAAFAASAGKEPARAVAEDITITQGEAFEVETDFTGITRSEKEEIFLKDAIDMNGQEFNSHKAGTYGCTYVVTPKKGESYEIKRNIVVKPREPETKERNTGSERNSNESVKEEEEPEPQQAEAQVKTSEDGVFLSVMPASASTSRETVSLVQGEAIYYPADLGNYLTTWFYVNGKVAYCVESSKASPPSADYVADVYESNLNLQKVLYYGYGGPGDLSGSYLNGYDDSLRYVLTHLAASYAYAGADVAFTGCYQSGLEKYGVMNYINHLYSQEAPPKAALSFDTTHQNAYIEGDHQRTSNFKLQGDHRNYVSLNLPDKVTYHNGSDSKTGGTAKIKGGTSFYFSAPKTVSGTWKSGTLKGQMGSQWKTLVISSAGDVQDIGYGEFYEEPSANVEFSVKWMDVAWVKVIKADSKTKVNLSGSVFGLYEDKGCTQLITKMPATDEKGATKVELIKMQDTIYLKEISVPTGYKINTSVFNVKLEAGKTQDVTVTNEEQMGKITIKKSGEVLTSVAGAEGNLIFSYTATAYANAKYKIFAAENIVGQDKKTSVYKQGELVQELTTGENGASTSKAIHLGKYKIVEQQAPHSLTKGKTEEERTKYVTLAYGGQTVELVQGETSYVNERPEVLVNVIKKSQNDDVTLKGAVFGLYAAEDIKNSEGKVLVKKGTLIEKSTSDGGGNAKFKADIPIDYDYYIEEIQAPTLYYMSTQRFDFQYTYKNDSTYTYTFEHTFSNKEVRGEVHIAKIDKDSQDFISQGDADLDGATYGLYAAKDIQYPNGKSGLVHKKDELVNQGVIKDGKLDFKNLYLGSYYIKEISAGEGYLVDPTVYPVEVGYESQDVAIVHRNVVVKETVKKQAFELIKISEDGEQTETDLVEGAGFKVFLISELSGVKDGSIKPSSGNSYTPEDFIDYDYEKEKTASYYENGNKLHVDELFTDKKGYLCSPELPYGQYVVFESTTPERLQTINPFIVTVNEDSRDPQPWRIFDDRPIMFYFKIIKEDAQTNLPVLENSAKYKIYDVENEKYVSMKVRYPEVQTIDVFETNAEGYLQTPQQLRMGTYRIEEVEAPNLYVQPGKEMALKEDKKLIPLNQVTTAGSYQEAGREVITVTIDANTAYEVEENTGKYIVVIRQKNDEAVGSLTIKKTGDFLIGATATKDKVTGKTKNIFSGAVNAVSNLLGGEDVLEKSEGYTFQYETGPAAGVGFSVYAKETIYSPDGQKDEVGNRIVLYEKDGLVAELITGEDGLAVLNNLPIGQYRLTETKPISNGVLLKESEFEIKYMGQEIAVDYVNMELHNERQKIELEIIKTCKETKNPVAGAEFGLYAEEAITNSKGVVVIEKDALVAKATSDEKGKVDFGIDLAHGKYYAKELQAAPGYLVSEEVLHFDATYKNPELETISLKAELENQPTVVEISKTDITDEKEMPGATLQIKTEDGKTVEEWTSTEEPHKVYGLVPEKYMLHEEAAPQGYLVVSDVPFEVKETGEVQKVSMKDERPVGQLIVKKTDAESKTPLKGVEFELRNKVSGEVIEKLVTSDDGIAKSKELPTALYENGKYVEAIVYVLVETKPLDGYEANTKEEEVVFTYVDDKTKVIEVMKEVTNQRLPGVEAPKTGDTTTIWIPIILAAVSAFGLGTLAYRIKKKKQK